MYTTLISSAELSRHLDEPDWCLVDCRFSLANSEIGRQHYQEGHLPGAIYAHLDNDLAAPASPAVGRHPLPDPAALVARLEQWGIASGGPDANDATQVVVYDDCGGAIAVRLWWMLRWLGHDKVALLDNGYAGWVAADLPLSREILQPTPAQFQARPDDNRWCSVQTLLGLLQRDSCLLLDCRDSERFVGHVEPIDPVAGHVPGARNLPYLENLASDGKFKGAETLRAMYENVLQGRAPQDVVHMCGSGVTACHNMLAMEIAGLKGSRLYPGSWSEWIGDPARPVAKDISSEMPDE